MTMMETAARALLEEFEPTTSWKSLDKEHRTEVLRMARTVVKAIREPSAAMLAAASEKAALAHWHTMIDVILGEKVDG